MPVHTSSNTRPIHQHWRELHALPSDRQRGGRLRTQEQSRGRDLRGEEGEQGEVQLKYRWRVEQFLSVSQTDTVIVMMSRTSNNKAAPASETMPPTPTPTPTPASAQDTLENNPLIDEDDILRHLIPFVADNEGYLFVAGVASTWYKAWVGGQLPKNTCLGNVVESASRLAWASSRLSTGGGTGGGRGGASTPWVWDESVCRRAAAGGHLGALKYARKQGCPWDATCTREAAAGGHLSLLRWAHANGCEWDASTPACAARCGDLDTLRFARRNGCPWDKTTCSEAARGGHLEILKWARSKVRARVVLVLCLVYDGNIYQQGRKFCSLQQQYVFAALQSDMCDIVGSLRDREPERAQRQKGRSCSQVTAVWSLQQRRSVQQQL